ncbi:hypothetical protein FSARC_4494 [Fusarium sarcochroum]|uniref:Uncharacterized protein n=1 Tax=Fusarium sarcochroum TaxID=1208366 RepID=A0A8H4U1F8_9HYPO|nr:hypothetical protein FSARC_4494 [Fusarium sarcochroum]
MASYFTHFQVQIGFLIALCRSTKGKENQIHSEFVHRSGGPIPLPPPEFFNTPSNAERHRELDQQDLIKAQWAIEQFEIVLYEQGLTKTNPHKDDTSTHEDQDDSESWTVAFDPNVSEYQCSQYQWVGLKLTSPCIRAGSLRLEQELKTVLDILDNHFLTVANSDTHLGTIVTPTEGDISLDQLKAITSMIWMVDPHLNEIHPPHCGPGSLYSLGLQYTNLARDCPFYLKMELASAVQVEDPWNNRLSTKRHPLELLPHPGELKQAKYRSGLDRILSSDSIEGLIKLMEVPVLDTKDYPQARPAYGFRAASESGPTAIEFNQHCGTLKAAEMVYWAVFCTELVQLCLEKPQLSLKEAWEGLKQGATIFTFLEAQGLNLVSEYFKAKEKALKIPDLKDWPIIRSSLSPDESEPIVRTDWPSSRALPSPLEEFAFRARDWEDSAKNTGNSNYSFGVELEMYIPAMPGQDLTLSHLTLPSSIDSDDMEIDLTNHPDSSDWPDPHPEDERKYARGYNFQDRACEIAQLVSSQGPLLLYHEDKVVRATRAWKKELAKHGMVPVDGISPKYQTWTIVEDGSLMNYAEWGDYWELQGMEIVSPVLRDTPEGWEEVLDIVSILRNNFRLAVTGLCGFHVHVAKGTEPFPLHLLRKVLVLMCCAENMIFSLCQPGRRYVTWSTPIMTAGSKLYDNYEDWWTGSDAPADFEQYIPVNKVTDPRFLGILKILWSASTLEDIQKLLQPNGFALKGCISLYSCETISKTHCKGTVEFRYLEGTVDPDLILRWSQLMVSLFQFADQASPTAWMSFVPTVLQCQSSGHCDLNVLRSFLIQLGLDNDYDFWVDRVRKISQTPRLSRLNTESFQRKRPDKDLPILPFVDESHAHTLRENVCKRERHLPAPPKNVFKEPEPPTGSKSRVKWLLEKAGFTSDQVEKALKDASGTRSQQTKAKAEREQQTQLEKHSGVAHSEGSSSEGSQAETAAYLLEVLQISRNQAKRELRKYHDA